MINQNDTYGQLDRIRTKLDNPENSIPLQDALYEILKDTFTGYYNRINLTAGLCQAIVMRHVNTINLILNLRRPFDLDYTQLISAAACAGHHDIMVQMITHADHEIDPTKLILALDHACVKGHHKIVRDLLDLQVPIGPSLDTQISSYDILIKKLLLKRVRLLDQSSHVIKHFIPCLALTRFHKTIRRRQLQKASLRMNLVKDELIAVYFSPERLPCLLPHRVNVQGSTKGQLIKQAAQALKLLF